MIGITMLVASLATAGAIFDISNPILRVTSSMRRLAAEDVDSAIPYTSRRDEIGLMAQSVETFRNVAIHSTRWNARRKKTGYGPKKMGAARDAVKRPQSCGLWLQRPDLRRA